MLPGKGERTRDRRRPRVRFSLRYRTPRVAVRVAIPLNRRFPRFLCRKRSRPERRIKSRRFIELVVAARLAIPGHIRVSRRNRSRIVDFEADRQRASNPEIPRGISRNIKVSRRDRGTERGDWSVETTGRRILRYNHPRKWEINQTQISAEFPSSRGPFELAPGDRISAGSTGQGGKRKRDEN